MGNYDQDFFLNYADFSGCQWRGIQWEQIEREPKAFAPGRAYFTGAVFGRVAKFTDAIFGECANFDGAIFDEGVSFEGAAFGWHTSFLNAVFNGDVQFTGKLKEQYFLQQRRRELQQVRQILSPLRSLPRLTSHQDLWKKLTTDGLIAF
jgi:Pentapeptide repeats (9 copies)